MIHDLFINYLLCYSLFWCRVIFKLKKVQEQEVDGYQIKVQFFSRNVFT
jgi:hypothetical protein